MADPKPKLEVKAPEGSAFADLLPEPLQPYYALIEGAALALLIFIIGWMFSKWANALVVRALKKSKFDPALAKFLGNITQYAVLAAAAIAALEKVGVQTTSLVAVFASAGLAIGLALQGSLSNFASGVMILLFRPFSLEDAVTIAGQTGVVKDVGLYSSSIHKPNNDLVTIPNSKIMSDVIINHTKLGTRRVAVDIGVGYGTKIADVEEQLLGVAKAVETALEDPAPAVAFTEMAASSINFKLFLWCKSEDFLATGNDARIRCYDALNDAGIEIPYDQIVVHNA